MALALLRLDTSWPRPLALLQPQARSGLDYAVLAAVGDRARRVAQAEPWQPAGEQQQQRSSGHGRPRRPGPAAPVGDGHAGRAGPLVHHRRPGTQQATVTCSNPCTFVPYGSLTCPHRSLRTWVMSIVKVHQQWDVSQPDIMLTKTLTAPAKPAAERCHRGRAEAHDRGPAPGNERGQQRGPAAGRPERARLRGAAQGSGQGQPRLPVRGSNIRHVAVDTRTADRPPLDPVATQNCCRQWLCRLRIRLHSHGHTICVGDGVLFDA